MPCDSGMSNASWSSDPVARAEVERLTRVSCDIMKMVEEAGVPTFMMSPETKQWWNQHKEVDARRRQAEEAPQRVAAKLGAGMVLSSLKPTVKP